MRMLLTFSLAAYILDKDKCCHIIPLWKMTGEAGTHTKTTTLHAKLNQIIMYNDSPECIANCKTVTYIY